MLEWFSKKALSSSSGLRLSSEPAGRVILSVSPSIENLLILGAISISLKLPFLVFLLTMIDSLFKKLSSSDLLSS